MLKPRHFPVIVAQIEDLIRDMRYYGDPLTEDEDTLVKDLGATAKGISSGQVVPPLEKPKTRHPLRQALMNTDRLEGVFPQPPDKRELFVRSYHLQLALFAGWRPYAAQKPPLPAPSPGLTREAPDFTHHRNAARRKSVGGKP